MTQAATLRDDIGATHPAGHERLLSLEPDLGNELPPELWRSLRRSTLVAVEGYECGAWEPTIRAAPASPILALLVIDGLLIREVQVAGRTFAELFGAGDLIQPSDPDDRIASSSTAWRALAAGRVAVIDQRLLATNPGALPLLTALAARSTQRGRALGALALTRTMRRTDERLLFLLTFLASRWGRMRADGIRLTLPVNHETLARLIGTRRQSVASTLQDLRQRGLLKALPDGDWLITKPLSSPPQTTLNQPQAFQCDQTVSLLDIDPQFAARIPSDQLDTARRHAHAPVRMLAPGAWDACEEYGQQHGWLGLLIASGFLVRRSGYHDQTAIEILGPGDLLRPWDDTGEWLPDIHTSWQTLLPSELVLLDEPFSHRIAPWPALTAEILSRATRRARWLAVYLAISQQTNTASRVMYLFARLAARWGTGPDRRHIPLPLTHSLIGELIGAQRPSVTAAISNLSRHDYVQRLPDATWQITRQC